MKILFFILSVLCVSAFAEDIEYSVVKTIKKDGATWQIIKEDFNGYGVYTYYNIMNHSSDDMVCSAMGDTFILPAGERTYFLNEKPPKGNGNCYLANVEKDEPIIFNSMDEIHPKGVPYTEYSATSKDGKILFYLQNNTDVNAECVMYVDGDGLNKAETGRLYRDEPIDFSHSHKGAKSHVRCTKLFN